MDDMDKSNSHDRNDRKESREKIGTEGKFTYESVQDARTLVEYLQALTEGFAKGSMRFTRKDLDLTLCPTGLIGFVVEAKGKDGRMKLNLKFTWRENVETKLNGDDTLAITPGSSGCQVAGD